MLIEINTGDITHHQDKLITSHNFNTINTIVNNPANPMPDELLLCVLIITPPIHNFLANLQN